MKRARIVLAALLIAGCATLEGPSLVPGQSTTGEVTARMGAPAMAVKVPNGDTRLYFTRYPWGRVVYVATLGPDGLLRGMDQRLNYRNIHAVHTGMREEQVREFLGPPREVTRLPRQQRDVWEYPWIHAGRELRVLWVQFSDDGVAREVIEMHDYKEQSESSKD